MLIWTNFVFLLFIKIGLCLNISVQFPSYPIDTDIGFCTCDLTPGQCDVFCCCDSSCSTDDQDAFLCSSRPNQYTNSTPVISTVQPTCFKDLSIFRSNSPYIIQKMGELVCIDYERYKGSQYYQKPTVQSVSANIFLQTINTDNAVLQPYTVSNDPGFYQVGTPILVNTLIVNGIIYALPVGLLNNPLCSGSQSITYMNNFVSKCSQFVSAITCTAILNPIIYNSVCFIQSPGNRIVRGCFTVTANSSVSGTFCNSALKSLTVTIYYENPTGIVNVGLSYSTENVPLNSFLEQIYTVQFIPNTTPSSSGTGNPGYRQGANIAAGISNGTGVNVVTSRFSLIRSLANGFCDSTESNRIPIRFGENIRSSCKYTIPSTCSSTINLLLPIDSTNLYVAAYGNSAENNLTRDWLPVILCISEIGNRNTRNCRISTINLTSTSNCYTRLDIQIAYTNIGSIYNPQPILSGIIFHYQYQTNTNPTVVLTQSVTFQNISTGPIVEQGQIPAPDTRLPANFLYPFAVSHGMKLTEFSLIFSILISIFFIFL